MDKKLTSKESDTILREHQTHGFTLDSMPTTQIKKLKPFGPELEPINEDEEIPNQPNRLQLDYSLIGKQNEEELNMSNESDRYYKRYMSGLQVEPGVIPEAFDIKQKDPVNLQDDVLADLGEDDISMEEMAELANEAFAENSFKYVPARLKSVGTRRTAQKIENIQSAVAKLPESDARGKIGQVLDKFLRSSTRMTPGLLEFSRNPVRALFIVFGQMFLSVFKGTVYYSKLVNFMQRVYKTGYNWTLNDASEALDLTHKIAQKMI